MHKLNSEEAFRKKTDSFETCWRRALWIPWTARKMNKCVLAFAQNVTGAKKTTLKLSYFGHIMKRQDSLAKTIKLGKTEDNRKRGTPGALAA